MGCQESAWEELEEGIDLQEGLDWFGSGWTGSFSLGSDGAGPELPGPLVPGLPGPSFPLGLVEIEWILQGAMNRVRIGLLEKRPPVWPSVWTAWEVASSSCGPL